MALDPDAALADDLPRLAADAKHARERYRLYRAKSYGPRATDPRHLRDLDRTATLAEQRLDRGARRRADAAPPATSNHRPKEQR